MEDAENYESSILISITDCFIVHKYPLACLGEAYIGMGMSLGLAQEMQAKAESQCVTFCVLFTLCTDNQQCHKKGPPWQLGSAGEDQCSRMAANLGCT